MWLKFPHQRRKEIQLLLRSMGSLIDCTGRCFTCTQLETVYEAINFSTRSVPMENANVRRGIRFVLFPIDANSKEQGEHGQIVNHYRRSVN